MKIRFLIDGLLIRRSLVQPDSCESADREAMDCGHWLIDHSFVLVPAQQYVGQFLATLKEFPPSQRPGSFSIDRPMEQLQEGGGTGRYLSEVRE